VHACACLLVCVSRACVSRVCLLFVLFALLQTSKHGVAFDDIYWKRHISSLKPIALASLLGARTPETSMSSIEELSRLQNRRLRRRMHHIRRREKRQHKIAAAQQIVQAVTDTTAPRDPGPVPKTPKIRFPVRAVLASA
jgi:hypothetical protein